MVGESGWRPGSRSHHTSPRWFRRLDSDLKVLKINDICDIKMFMYVTFLVLQYLHIQIPPDRLRRSHKTVLLWLLQVGVPMRVLWGYSAATVAVENPLRTLKGTLTSGGATGGMEAFSPLKIFSCSRRQVYPPQISNVLNFYDFIIKIANLVHLMHILTFFAP